MKKTVLSAVAAITLALPIIESLPAEAAVTYTYTGHVFGFSLPPYTASDKISGYLTVSDFLGPDLLAAIVNPIAFSFSDGHQTITNANNVDTTPFTLTTDSNGDMLYWTISLNSDSQHSIDLSYTGALGADQAVIPGAFAFNTSSPGTWVVTGSPDTVSSAPEPATMSVLGSALLGLAALRRRSRVRDRAA